jgi:hypothetical protein
VTISKNTPYPVGKKVFILETQQYGWVVKVGKLGDLRIRIDEIDQYKWCRPGQVAIDVGEELPIGTECSSNDRP